MHIGHEDAFLWSVVKLESTESANTLSCRQKVGGS